MENVECYDAIEGGVTPQSIYSTFIPRHAQMNFDKVKAEVYDCLRDTLQPRRGSPSSGPSSPRRSDG